MLHIIYDLTLVNEQLYKILQKYPLSNLNTGMSIVQNCWEIRPKFMLGVHFNYKL